MSGFPKSGASTFSDCPPVITQATWPERLTLFFMKIKSGVQTKKSARATENVRKGVRDGYVSV
jgi:hypothetical protein